MEKLITKTVELKIRLELLNQIIIMNVKEDNPIIKAEIAELEHLFDDKINYHLNKIKEQL